jgi:hypothetical protein
MADYLWVRNKMMQLRHRMRTHRTFEEAISTFSAEDQAVFRSAQEWGVLKKSFTQQDIGDLGGTRTFAQRVNPLSRKGPLVHYGGIEMESVEDFLRMSCFKRWHSELGGQAARDWTLAVHFDYQNLTQLEEKIKKVVPFFVWSRRNLPLQMRMLVERPDLVVRYNHLVYGMSENMGDPNSPYDGLPFGQYAPSLATATGIVFNKNTPAWARMILSPDLPLNDLANISNPISPMTWVRYATSTLGPQVSLPFAAQQAEEFGDVNAPAGIAQILLGLHALGLYSKVTDEGIPRMSRSSRMWAETAMPLTAEYLRPWDQDPARLERLGISESAGVFAPERFLGQGVQMARGFGLQTQTPSDIYAGAWDQKAKLDAILKSLRLKGKLPMSEEEISALEQQALASGS